MSAKSPVTRIHSAHAPRAPEPVVAARRPVPGPRPQMQELRADGAAAEHLARIAHVEAKAGVLMPWLALLMAADLFLLSRGEGGFTSVLLGSALALFALSTMLMFSCFLPLDLAARIESARLGAGTREAVVDAAARDLDTIAADRRERFIWAYGAAFIGLILGMSGAAFALMG
jgi:hypothetical protein